MDDEFFIKYLELIQKIIERMARNSFQIKAWTATLFAAIIVLTYSIINILIFIVLIFTICMFWALDSYYLRQEKLFRELYNAKVKEFNENAKNVNQPYSMRVDSYKKDEDSTLRIMFSISEFLYYIAFLITIIVFLIVYLTINWQILV
ncbi:hypothetical protein ES708_17653 [subsurface metagenome]